MKFTKYLCFSFLLISMSTFPVHASELSDAKDEKNTLSNQIIASQTAIQNYSFEQDNAQQEIQNINPEIEEIESTISSLEKEVKIFCSLAIMLRSISILNASACFDSLTNLFLLSLSSI